MPRAKSYPRKGNGKAVQWIRAHVNYAGGDCLTWPFATYSGYGRFGHCGRVLYAHRYMCELVNGPAPSPDHESSHSCGRGAKGCVHPKHLSWKTRGENQADRTVHGTQSIGARGTITAEQAEQIRALKGKVTQEEIARMFGTSRSNVSTIHCGKAWVREYKGYQQFGNRFHARIWHKRKKIRLGIFDTAEEATRAYANAAAKITKGSFVFD